MRLIEKEWVYPKYNLPIQQGERGQCYSKLSYIIFFMNTKTIHSIQYLDKLLEIVCMSDLVNSG